MIRKIIEIDREKCNGCGLCVNACHEGAIGLVNGKAELLRDDYCDGLGNCLPVCPTNAISFVEREALAFDEEAVKKNMTKVEPLPCGCPGTHAQAFRRAEAKAPAAACSMERQSQLGQWPVQIKLVPVNAPYFNGADLLVAADCAAYAYAGFHEDFISGKITLIGCPKLDEGDYSEKLAQILAANNIRSVTVARMQVPCCGGIEQAVRIALEKCGKDIPLTVSTIATDGHLLGK